MNSDSISKTRTLIVVSGRSGSGKSAALNVLEDSGYTCIDNLPASFLTDLFARSDNAMDAPRIAVSIDVRNLWRNLKDIPDMVATLRKQGVDCKIVFLDASTNTLIKRFSETRRRHPLSGADKTLAEALAEESVLLKEIEQVAGIVVNTDNSTPNEFSDYLNKVLALNQNTEDATESPKAALLLFQSFGFKHGLPIHADYIFDVRCLPNPYWIPELRQYTGRETPVQEYLTEQPAVEDMVLSIQHFLSRWLPDILAGSRSYITVAIGCTGGKHRSVYLTERLTKIFTDLHSNVLARHRELTDD